MPHRSDRGRRGSEGIRVLYAMYAWQQAALVPLRLAALTGHKLFSNPFLPVSATRYGRTMAAACEMVERSTRHYTKPAFGLAARETEVARTEFCTLLNFERPGCGEQPRVLLVAPLSGHHPTLLRGTVAALLPDHDVFITDWHDAKFVPRARGGFDLDDYIDHLIAFLRRLGPHTHVIAVCQPAVPALAAAALMAAANDASRPRSLVLMGGPIDTRINPTRVNRFAARHPIGWFERTIVTPVPYGYPGSGRRVYPGFLQLSGFMAMNMDRHIGAHLRMFDHLIRGDGDGAAQHRQFYDEYMSVMDLPAEFYLDTVELVFQRHVLPRGVWVSRGRRIEPAAIEQTALMTIEGELDDISAPGQTHAAHRLCPAVPDGRRDHLLAERVGHYGIFNGRRWRETIYPRVRDFIRRHERAPPRRARAARA